MNRPPYTAAERMAFRQLVLVTFPHLISNFFTFGITFTGIRPDVPDNEEIQDGNDTMETAVEDFYESFMKTYKELRQKCKNELIQLAKVKHKGIYNFSFGESQA